MALAQTSPGLSERVFLSENSHFHVRKWSVKECHFLVDNELIDPVKFELIEGEIVSKMGQGRQHIVTVTALMAKMSEVFDPKSIQIQAPVGIGQIDEYNDPEPDIAIIRGAVADYIDSELNPVTDVLLAIEAAKTTLHGDKTTKARLYGKHGIREYWIVAIEKRELIVHRGPNTADGGYADVRTYTETDSVSPLASPDATICVADLLS